jgi:hypothetical protein
VTEVLVMLIIFSPALAFFGGRTFLKYQEIKHRSGGALDSSTTKRLEALEAENADLKQRVETLETIATTVGIDGAAKLKELEEEARRPSR